jgi:hypothetical protein
MKNITKNLWILVTEQEGKKILGFYQKLKDSKNKIYLSAISEEMDLPIAIIKSFLEKFISEEELKSKYAHWDSKYIVEDFKYNIIDGKYQKSKTKYIYFTNGKSKTKSHLWLVSRLCGMTVKEFVDKGYIVHHMDGNGLNNDLYNLIPIEIGLHRQLHGAINKYKDLDQLEYIQNYTDNAEYFNILYWYMGEVERLDRKLRKIGI